MTRKRKEGSAQSGQAAVLIALSLFSMVVFLAMATNYGILVNDRIRMQNAADLSAYAGAFEQARALNRLTHINKRIFLVAYNLRKGLTCPGTPPHPSPEDVLEANTYQCNRWGNPFIGKYRVWPDLQCKNQNMDIVNLIFDIADLEMRALRAAFLVENMRAKSTSMRAARITADRNYRGTGRPTKINFFQRMPDSPTARIRPLIDVGDPPDPVSTGFTWGWFHIPGKCGCPRGRLFPPKRPKFCIYSETRYLDTWFIKKNYGPTVYFPTRVRGVPMKDFLDIPGASRNGYFGAGSVPGKDKSDELWTFAVAKPFAGHMGANDSNGSTESIKFDLKKPSIARNSKTVTGYGYNSFDKADVDASFVEKYRARMAGIQDTMLKDRSGTYSDRAIKPLDLMMADLVRATKASPPEIENYMVH